MAYNNPDTQSTYQKLYYAKNKAALNAARYARTLAELAANPERMKAKWRVQSKAKRSRAALREAAEAKKLRSSP